MSVKRGILSNSHRQSDKESYSDSGSGIDSDSGSGIDSDSGNERERLAEKLQHFFLLPGDFCGFAEK